MALLSTDDFREHVTTSLGDAALQRLLDAAEAAIAQRLGPVGAVTEYHTGGSSVILLRRAAGSITSVTETVDNVDTALAADDYRLAPDGLSLTRLLYGTNPSSGFVGTVKVIYAAADDVALRKVAQLELVDLDLRLKVGLASEATSEWSRTYRTDKTYAELREEILAGLTPVWTFA